MENVCHVYSLLNDSPFVSNPETVPEHLNLRSSEVSTESFRVTWEHSGQDVLLYRLFWIPTRGGDTKEVCMSVCQVFCLYVHLGLLVNLFQASLLTESLSLSFIFSLPLSLHR